MRYWCAVLLCIYFQQHVLAQSVKKSDSINIPLVSNMLPSKKDEMITIADVIVTGNKKTKAYIIIRETTFKKGDNISIGDLAQKLIESKQLIYNTGLFVDDSVYVSQQKGNVVYINIDVKERWYFFPLPFGSISRLTVRFQYSCGLKA